MKNQSGQGWTEIFFPKRYKSVTEKPEQWEQFILEIP